MPDPDRPVSREKLFDTLPEHERDLLQKSIAEVALGADHEKVYRECVERGRADLLNKKEKEILMRLAMADEAGNNDQVIRDLTNELMQVQKQIRSRR